MLEFSPSRLLNGQDTEKQFQQNIELADSLLSDDNRVRKRLPEEKGSLLKAISDTLYFTPRYSEEIQEYLIRHLKYLIASNKLPQRLSMFQGNSILLKDFVMSPHVPGFEKINLELASSAFGTRATVYGVTEDEHLSSLIINARYTKDIEFMRTKNNHYDPVYSVDFMEKAGFCQNIVLNILEKVLNNADQSKDINGDRYVNFEYNNWIARKNAENNLDQFRITRGRHKKSLSDPYAKNRESPDDQQQMKIYNIFTNMKPPEDFLSKINMRKDTVESNFSINADLDFVDEQEPPPTNKEFAIKNYPIASAGSSFNKTRQGMRPLSPQPERNRQIHQGDIFFHENLSLAEIERLEKTPSNGASAISSGYYVAPEQPTYTPPPRYMPNTYSFTEAVPNINGALDNSSPTFKPKNMGALGVNNYSHSHSLNETPSQNPYGMNSMNYQHMYPPHPQSYDQSYMPNDRHMQMQMAPPGSYNANLSGMTSYNHQQIQGNFSNNNNNSMIGNAIPTGKKKNVALDDNRRYSGRLKFFDEMKNYGFIIMDEDGSDLFVHYDDLAKAGLNKDLLKTAKSGNVIKLTFICMQYLGKYNRSRKAVDIQVGMR